MAQKSGRTESPQENFRAACCEKSKAQTLAKNRVGPSALGAARMLAYEFDDVVHSGAGRKDFRDPKFFQSRNVFIGNDAAAEDDDVVKARFTRQFDDARKQCHVRA